MSNPRDNLIAWLRDAHAMEMQAIDMMEAHSSRLEHYGQLKTRIDDHVVQTRDQARRLEQCLHSLGSDTSGMKTGIARASSMLQALAGSTASDEVVKNAIGEASFERFEAANYRCLIAAAEAAGEPEVARICNEILQEELAMADWLDQQLPLITRQYLGLAEQVGSAGAKR